MSKVAYKTILAPIEGLYKEKGSKFLSKAYPIKSEEEAKEILHGLKKEFYDAQHICYALSLQGQILLERANDDGEPAHTAGTPILNQIKSFEVSNILVVVVRYFGGTKLGVSGLIQAYKTAAEEALSLATFHVVEPKEHYRFIFPYEQTGQVMHWLKELNGTIVSERKTEQYELVAEMPVDSEESLREKWQALQHVVLLERLF
jgi:uncharacterized YigZ family protein